MRRCELVRKIHESLDGEIYTFQVEQIINEVLGSIRLASNAQYAAGYDALSAESGCLFSAYTAMIDLLLEESETEEPNPSQTVHDLTPPEPTP